MALCLTDDIENLVKPDRRDEWKEQKEKWFVKDHLDAWDLRRPGKMKLEWASKNGAMIRYTYFYSRFLSPLQKFFQYQSKDLLCDQLRQ